MMFRRKKRTVPGINATSTADISFILLVFFLVISSMDSNKGLQRNLPPKDDDRQEQVREVDERNVMDLHISAAGDILVDGKAVTRRALQAEVVRFVTHAPSRKEHVISVTMDGKARYDDYFFVQDALSRAYAAMRDTYARQHFRKPYARCSAQEKDAVRKEYPQRVTEEILSEE